ncbi:MAG: FAD-dependent oxidoreductase, partial [Acidobacteriota bacterium]|nr:FAD-dependent oxidoreductase [Acidobacteriota bacterium]
MKLRKAAAWAACGIGGAASVYAGWRVLKQAGIARENGSLARGKKIVILGAGFGGVNAARELARLLPGSGNGEIILVDQHPFLLFTPMLSEAAGGELDPRHIVSSVQKLPHRITFVQGRVDSI